MPFVLPELQRERWGMAAVSSSMMFYAGMEKARRTGGGKKQNDHFALCMYLYVVCSVQIYLASTCDLGSRKEKKILD